MNPSNPPTSAPVIREPTAWVTGPGVPFFSATFSITGPISRAKPSVFARIQADLSTTRTGAVSAPASSPVKSWTYAVERSAPLRSSATVAAASAAETSGPAPARRDPIETASSQSTMSVVMSRAYGHSAATGRERRRQAIQGRTGVERLGVLHVVADKGEDQRPAAGVGGDPGQGAGAGQGAGLGAYQATAGAVLEAVSQRPVVARDRQAGDHRAELGVLGGGGQLEHLHERVGVEPVVPRETAAVLDPRPPQVDAQAANRAR